MILILEGPDGAGKTMLAKRLAKELAANILHKKEPAQSALLEYQVPRAAEFSRIICDRWHISEVVYGPIRRGFTDLSPIRQLRLEDSMRANGGAVLVTLNPPLATLVERLEARGEEFDFDQLCAESAAFNTVSHKSTLPSLYLNYVWGEKDVAAILALFLHEESALLANA